MENVFVFQSNRDPSLALGAWIQTRSEIGAATDPSNKAYDSLMNAPDFELLAVNVGNTRVGAAVYCSDEQLGAGDAPSTDVKSAADMIVELAHELNDSPHGAVVVASVNEPAAESLCAALDDRLSLAVYRVGVDLPIQLTHTLGDDHTTGVDRFLNAVAAFDTVHQACVVVDAGTAVTVDFIDGEGTFHGGAIAPGARMQLAALHEQTANLPIVDLAWPDDAEPFARTTAQAMLAGVCVGIQGMTRALVERYAEAYGAYPTIIATGGDAELLFKNDDLIERIVPDLTLRGIAVSAQKALDMTRAPADLI